MLEFDVVAIADFREGSPVASDVDEALDSWAASGQRVGLVQANRGDNVVAPMARTVRMHLDLQHAWLLLPDDAARSPMVVAWWSEDLLRLNRPAIDTQRVVVVPSGVGRAMQVTSGLQEAGHLFGMTPEFAPKPPALPDARASKVSAVGRSRQASVAGDQRTVLMVSSNGTGMGHLTRLLSYARRASADVRPYFLSLSQAAPVVSDFGFPYEYVPSATPTGMAPGRWRSYLASRLGEAIERLGPDTVVFDGTWAYEAFRDVRNMYGDVRWVWSRRGMWYRGMNRDQLAKAAWFDAVIEPGDFSSPADPGVTADEPTAVRVGPVTLLDHDELLSRDEARAALDIKGDVPAALVTLGAGNINDATSDVRLVINALRALGMEICVTVPAIAERASTDDEHVRLVTTFPLARYLHTFDVAVSAAGYNSFHELLRFGVPTLFLPNRETSLDDQATRARYAADRGWAYSLEKPTPAAVASALESLLRDGRKMAAAVAEIDPGNGAGAAMDVVAGLARKGA